MDLLMELTTHEYWGALWRYRERHSRSLQSKILTPSTDLFGLVEKEVTAARLGELDRFFRGLESDVDAHAKARRKEKEEGA